MRNVPVVANLCHWDGGSGAPTTEERHVGGVCLVAGSPSIVELPVEGIQCSRDITLRYYIIPVEKATNVPF